MRGKFELVILAVLVLISSAACKKQSSTYRPRKTTRKRTATPPPPAPAAPAPAPVPPPAPAKKEEEKEKKSATGFEYGAKERVTENMYPDMDGGKRSKYGQMVKNRDRSGILADPMDALRYVLEAALTDDEGEARFALEVANECCVKINIVDDQGKISTFNFQKFNSVAHRAGFVGLYLQTIRDNPDMFK